MEYPDLAALPVELREAVQDHGSLNVFRMIMHSPGLAPGMLALSDAILGSNSLPDDLRELAIVRVGHAYGAAYEVHHHERAARLVGVSERALAAAADAASAGNSPAPKPPFSSPLTGCSTGTRLTGRRTTTCPRS